jgi:signal transduction histidine kinase
MFSNKSGYARPFASRAYKHRHFVFPVQIPAQGEQVIYLRVEAPLSLEIPAMLWNRVDFHEHESKDLLIQAMYFGMVFAMFSFNFLLWILLADRIYGWYLLFVLAAAMGQAGVTGIGVQFFWGDLPGWTTIALGVSACLTGIGLFLTMREMLSTPKIIPKFDQLITVLIVINLISLASSFFYYRPDILVYIGIVNSVATLIGASICAFKGQRSAKLFLVAFSFLLLGIIVFVLRVKNILPNSLFTVHGMQIGSAMEMILLAFALADRFNQIRQEKARVQRELLQAQQETLQAQAATMQAQAEKVTSLTQLVSNVAHEINNPIGAVKSSGKHILDALGEVLGNLQTVSYLLEPGLRGLFNQLVMQANSSVATVLTTREERSIRNSLALQLEQAGIEKADRKAKSLVGLRVAASALDYLPLLRHAQSELILDTAAHMAGIVSNTININTAVERVAKMVSTLKSFSEEDLGEMAAVNVKDSIEAVLVMYSSRIKQGIELVREYNDLPLLPCLPEGLAQVWTHLIHNALQAIDNTGTLTIGLRHSGNEAVVSISDSGSGIPADIRERIFEPFFTTRPPGEGSGLGLSIVKKILNRHKGRIEVQTELGTGSTFLVYLPYPSV